MAGDETGEVTVLLVQQDSMLAHQVAEQLQDYACRVVGPLDTPQGVRNLLNETAVDHALVDVALDSFVCRRIVGMLAERRIPYFVFAG